MTRKANSRRQHLLLWGVVAFAVALILLRLLVFVSHVRPGHRRHVAAIALSPRSKAGGGRAVMLLGRERKQPPADEALVPATVFAGPPEDSLSAKGEPPQAEDWGERGS